MALTDRRGGALDTVDPGPARDDVMMAEEILDSVLASCDEDAEEFDPDQAAAVRRAWALVLGARSATIPQAPDLAWWSSVVMGRVAIVGAPAGLDDSVVTQAATALRTTSRDSLVPSDVRGVSLEVLAGVLLELVELAEDRSRRVELLTEVVDVLMAGRELVSDAASYLGYTAELGHQAYRCHCAIGPDDHEMLEVAIAELHDLARSGQTAARDRLVLANAYEDRYLAGRESDRERVVEVVSELLELDEVPAWVAASALSLRGRVLLDDAPDPATEAAAMADLSAALDVLDGEDYDGWIAARTVACVLLEHGVRAHDDALTAIRCLDVLLQGPDDDPDTATLQNLLAFAVIEGARRGLRWDDAYLPALEMVTTRADRDPADVELALAAALGTAIRAGMLFLTQPRGEVEELLTEATNRLEAAVRRPDVDDEAAADLHALAAAMLWLVLTPDDWSPIVRLSDKVSLGVPLKRDRPDLARRALEHASWLDDRAPPAKALPFAIIFMLRCAADSDLTFSEQDVEALRRGTTGRVPSDAAVLGGLDSVRGSLLAEEGWRRRDATLLAEAIVILRQAVDEGMADQPLHAPTRAILEQSLQRLGWITQHDTRDDTLTAAAPQEVGALRREVSDASAVEQEALALRRQGDPEARRVGRTALRRYGRRVIVEPDTAVALGIAEQAGRWASVVATWALEDDCPDEAVDALERGRAMVLYAVTATAHGAAILQAIGHESLAADWATGHLDEARGAELLMALGDTPAGQMLHVVPDCSDIGAGVWALAADALVYLVQLPPREGLSGLVALMLRPDRGVEVLRLPPLDDAPLQRYVSAYQRAFGSPAAPPADADDLAAAHTGWREALDDLCDWAEQAVASSLRDHVATWGLGRTPRLIVVPIGELALVPWAAARRRTEQGWRYLAHDLRISSAASARQLIEVSRRGRLPTDQVMVVASPRADLPYARRLALALREHIYPDAVCAGQPAGHFGSRRGTRDDVLTAMPSAGAAGVGVFHLSAHAGLDPAPENSHIALADGDLRVGQLLDQARFRDPAAAGGLVVLACCATDRAARMPDEALTLATAFLAAGAASAVGTRWPVADGAAAVACYVLHRLLADGTEPAEAVRHLQLWLIDPARQLPEGMPRPLADVAARAPLDRPEVWAAFTHHGR